MTLIQLDEKQLLFRKFKSTKHLAHSLKVKTKNDCVTAD